MVDQSQPSASLNSIVPAASAPSTGVHGLYSRLHVFRTFRTLLCVYAAPFFASLAVLDFYYAPEVAVGWLPLRLSVPLISWGMFHLLVKKAWLRRRIYAVVLAMWSWLGVILGVMVYQSGGATSCYVVGATTCSVSVILLFNLPPRLAALTQFSFFLSVATGILLAPGSVDPAVLVTVLVLLATTTVTATIGSFGGLKLDRAWVTAERRTRAELDRHRRSEVLKAHFPPLVRRAIEAGTIDLSQRVILPEAVVGFADMIESTTIGNRVELATDWDLKEAFLSAATARATAAGMVVLNQMGDGFFFIANFGGGDDDWSIRLLNFHEDVIRDFQTILLSLAAEIGPVSSGVRFGVARGPAMLGWIGKGGQSYFTATGPEVNLAARLCAAARPDGMVLSAETRNAMDGTLGAHACESALLQLKGFAAPVTATHVSANLPAPVRAS